MTVDEICKAAKDGAKFRVASMAGVAWRFDRPETEAFWDYERGIYPEEPDERETGMVVMVMVGDDREFVVDPDDCDVVDEFCPECGQIGCKAYAS